MTTCVHDLFLFCLLERKKQQIRKSEAVLSSCQSHDTQDVLFQSVMIHSEHLSTSDPFLAVECEEKHKVTFKTKGGTGVQQIYREDGLMMTLKFMTLLMKLLDEKQPDVRDDKKRQTAVKCISIY